MPIVDYTRRSVAGPLLTTTGWLVPCPACGRTGRTVDRVDRLVEHIVEYTAHKTVIVRDGCTIPLPACARAGCDRRVPVGPGALIGGLDGVFCSGECGERAWREAATASVAGAVGRG